MRARAHVVAGVGTVRAENRGALERHELESSDQRTIRMPDVELENQCHRLARQVIGADLAGLVLESNLDQPASVISRPGRGILPEAPPAALGVDRREVAT